MAKQGTLQYPQNHPTFYTTSVGSSVRILSPVLVLYIKERWELSLKESPTGYQRVIKDAHMNNNGEMGSCSNRKRQEILSVAKMKRIISSPD